MRIAALRLAPKSETLAYLHLPTGMVPALVQDLTEQGVSIQAAEPLVPLRSVALRFLLPGSTHVLHATADFIWADEEGRAGLILPGHSSRLSPRPECVAEETWRQEI